jgi:hypothetical protein
MHLGFRRVESQLKKEAERNRESGGKERECT